VQINDKVWFDLRHRLAGIVSDVKALSSTHNILVLAHFPATVSAIESSLRAADVTFQTFSMFDSSGLCSTMPTGTVFVGLVRALQQPNLMRQPATSSVRIIVAEHHPRANNDQHVIDVAEKLPCDAEVQFHTSLDDPLMMRFGGEKLTSLMKTLGMEESEAVEHRFVTNAIRNAQEKLEQLVPREIPTESIDDWFKFNLRTT
jgi:hypothetical protein